MDERQKAFPVVSSPASGYLSCFLGARGKPLHCGEADVELLDDGGVQAVEIQQQDELVIETCNTGRAAIESQHFEQHCRKMIKSTFTEL